jgi:CubicO group peptidase (beta-lactamase class C family)
MFNTLQSTHLAAIETLIEKGMRDFNVPGVAIAIVDGERVLFQRGFGVRDVESRKPVTVDTLFMLASVSKAFTVSAMHASADAGQFKWDTPVTTYLPEFALADDRATREMTVRDLVTHRCGLPRHDHVWLERDISDNALVSALKHLQPNSSFRSTYHYQNLMYMTAGHLLSRVSNVPWDRALKKSVFSPLGMRRATASVTTMKADSDHANGYELIDNKPLLVQPMNLRAMAPTGGVIASAAELSRFILMHLSRGTWRSHSVLSEAAVSAMQTPETVMTETIEWPEIGATQYGMGWFLTHYRGKRLVHHGGNLRGFSTLASFLPQEKLGIIFLSNAGASPLRAPLTYAIYDLLLDLSPIDWLGRYKGYVDSIVTSAKKAQAEKFSLRKGSAFHPPAAVLDEFVGDYKHPAYGLVTIERESKRLAIKRHTNAAPLNHLHHDVFMTSSDKLSQLSRVCVSFQRAFDGEVSGLSIPFEPAVKAIEFGRVPASSLVARKTLQRYVGRYAFGQKGACIDFDQRGNALTLHIAPLPRYTLISTATAKFRVKESAFMFVQFGTIKRGRAMTMCIIDSTGEFAGDRI